MAQGLQVVAMAEVLPQHRDTVKDILVGLAEATRRESGCLSYEVFCDSANPAWFNTIELWRDGAAFEAHMGQPHTTQALGALQDKLAGTPQIRVLSQLA